MSIPAAGAEIKQPTKHVEAAIRVVSGRGFNSPRLHSIRPVRAGLNVLSERSESKGIRPAALARAKRVTMFARGRESKGIRLAAVAPGK